MRFKFHPHLLLTAFIAAVVLLLAVSSATGVQASPFKPNALATKATATPKGASSTPDPRFIDSGAIADGDSVSGDIDDDHVYFIYTYEGTKGDALSLSMTVKGGLIPYIGVTTNDQKDILKDIVGKKGDKSAKLSVTLPDDGSYLILVGRGDGSKGSSTGSFTLSFSAQAGNGGGSSDVQPIDPTGDPDEVVGRLQTAGLVPDGGKQLISVKDSFGTTSDVGNDFLRIGRGSQAQDLVMSFIVGWATAGSPASACGMSYRYTATGDYSAVLISNDSHLVAYQTNGQNDPLFSFDEEQQFFDFDKGNIVTVVAIGEKVSIFVNGKFVTEQTGKAAKGVFAIQVYNPKKNKGTTDCRYADIWVWSFK